MSSSWCQSAAVALTGSAVEFGWAVGEAVMIPHLVNQLQVPTRWAGTIYLFNPIMGIWLQPLFGQASDSCTSRHGKRRPFIVGLALLGVVSMIGLVWSPALQHRQQVLCCFVLYTLLDCSHDLLLVPGRSLRLDLAAPSEQEWADSQYTQFQLFGRLCALCLGAFAIEHALPGDLSHFQALFLCSIVVLVGCTSSAWLGGRQVDQPADKQVDGDSAGEVEGDKLVADQPTSAMALWCVLIVQFWGWVMVSCQSFWWMQFVGKHTLAGFIQVSFAGLAVQALVGAATCEVVPLLIRLVGDKQLFMATEIMMALVMGLTWWVDGSTPSLTILLAAISGLHYGLHPSVVHILVRRIANDPDRQGFFIALANNTLTAAQILVAAVSGFIVEAADDKVQTLFVMSAIASLFVFCLVLLADSVWHIIPPPSGHKADGKSGNAPLDHLTSPLATAHANFE